MPATWVIAPVAAVHEIQAQVVQRHRLAVLAWTLDSCRKPGLSSLYISAIASLHDHADGCAHRAMHRLAERCLTCCRQQVGAVKALADMLNQASGPSATSTAQANEDCLFSVKARLCTLALCMTGNWSRTTADLLQAHSIAQPSKPPATCSISLRCICWIYTHLPHDRQLVSHNCRLVASTQHCTAKQTPCNLQHFSALYLLDLHTLASEPCHEPRRALFRHSCAEAER